LNLGVIVVRLLFMREKGRKRKRKMGGVQHPAGILKTNLTPRKEKGKGLVGRKKRG